MINLSAVIVSEKYLYIKTCTYKLCIFIFRTTSEGNHFGKIFPIKSSGGAKYSITSGSPMSPGSYMSSESNAESAGSSNSIDDTEIPYGMTHSLFEYFSFNNII